MKNRLEALVTEMVDRGILYEDAVEEFEKHLQAPEGSCRGYASVHCLLQSLAYWFRYPRLVSPDFRSGALRE